MNSLAQATWIELELYDRLTMAYTNLANKNQRFTPWWQGKPLLLPQESEAQIKACDFHH